MAYLTIIGRLFAEHHNAVARLMTDLLQIVVIMSHGWEWFLRKGAYPDHVPFHVRFKHFLAWGLICNQCLDLTVQFGYMLMHFGDLEMRYSKTLIFFDPIVSILIDLIGGAFGAACVVFCLGVLWRSAKAFRLFRASIPLLAAYYIFVVFRTLYERGYNFVLIEVTIAAMIGIPTALLLCFYCKRKNVAMLFGDREAV